MIYHIVEKATNKNVATFDTKTGLAECREGFNLVNAAGKVEEEKGNAIYRAPTFFGKVSINEFAKDFINPRFLELNPDVNPIGRSYSYYSAIKLPERATAGSAGYDFFAPIDLIITEHSSITVPTGIKVAMPRDMVLLLHPRSSLGFKYKLTLDDTISVIDSDYYNNAENEGHIIIQMTNNSDQTCFIPQGGAFCQGVFMKYFLTDLDDYKDKNPRIGGMGSTDK